MWTGRGFFWRKKIRSCICSRMTSLPLQVLKLGHDLRRAVHLFDMLKRREKTKLALLDFDVEILTRRAQMGDYGSAAYSQMMAKVDFSHFFLLFLPWFRTLHRFPSRFAKYLGLYGWYCSLPYTLCSLHPRSFPPRIGTFHLRPCVRRMAFDARRPLPPGERRTFATRCSHFAIAKCPTRWGDTVAYSSFDGIRYAAYGGECAISTFRYHIIANKEYWMRLNI